MLKQLSLRTMYTKKLWLSSHTPHIQFNVLSRTKLRKRALSQHNVIFTFNQTTIVIASRFFIRQNSLNNFVHPECVHKIHCNLKANPTVVNKVSDTVVNC